MEAKSRKRRRSSILKKSPHRKSLADLDPNTTNEIITTEDETRRGFKRRVSFANTYQVKEIHRAADIAEKWHDTTSDIDTTNISELSRKFIPKKSLEIGVEGLNTLLSAPIVHCDVTSTNSDVTNEHNNVQFKMRPSDVALLDGSDSSAMDFTSMISASILESPSPLPPCGSLSSHDKFVLEKIHEEPVVMPWFLLQQNDNNKKPVTDNSAEETESFASTISAQKSTSVVQPPSTSTTLLPQIIQKPSWLDSPNPQDLMMETLENFNQDETMNFTLIEKSTEKGSQLRSSEIDEINSVIDESNLEFTCHNVNKIDEDSTTNKPDKSLCIDMEYTCINVAEVKEKPTEKGSQLRSSEIDEINSVIDESNLEFTCHNVNKIDEDSTINKPDKSLCNDMEYTCMNVAEVKEISINEVDFLTARNSSNDEVGMEFTCHVVAKEVTKASPISHDASLNDDMEMTMHKNITESLKLDSTEPTEEQIDTTEVSLDVSNTGTLAPKLCTEALSPTAPPGGEYHAVKVDNAEVCGEGVCFVEDDVQKVKILLDNKVEAPGNQSEASITKSSTNIESISILEEHQDPIREEDKSSMSDVFVEGPDLKLSDDMNEEHYDVIIEEPSKIEDISRRNSSLKFLFDDVNIDSMLEGICDSTEDEGIHKYQIHENSVGNTDDVTGQNGNTERQKVTSDTSQSLSFVTSLTDKDLSGPIGVEEFLKEYTDVRIGANKKFTKSRRSLIVPMTSSKPETLGGLIKAVYLQSVNIPIYEQFKLSIREKLEKLESEIKRNEKSIFSSNPELMQTIRFGSNEESVRMIEEVESLATNCKKLAKAQWRFAKSKLTKGLAQSIDTMLVSDLSPIADKITSFGNVTELLENAVDELGNESEQLDSDLKRFEGRGTPPSDEQIKEFLTNEKEIEELNQKLKFLAEEKRKKEMEKRMWRKDLEDLWRKAEENEEYETKVKEEWKKVEIKKREEKLIQSFTPWRIIEDSTTKKSFGFLKNTWILHLFYDEGKMKSVKFESLLSGIIPSLDVAVYKLLHRLIQYKVDKSLVFGTSPLTQHLHKILNAVSRHVASANFLYKEIMKISSNCTSCSLHVVDDSIVVDFYSRNPKLCNFKVQFNFVENEEINCDFKPVSYALLSHENMSGKFCEKDVMETLYEVNKQGHSYFQRLVESIITMMKM